MLYCCGALGVEMMLALYTADFVLHVGFIYYRFCPAFPV